MKRSLFTRNLKQTVLAVPAAALMLGAAHGQTTIGLNFQGWYYNSSTTPQTVGFGAGYQTTGFPVTAAAFGVPATNWFNTDPLPAYAISGYATFGGTATTFAGGLTANVSAPDVWESGIGEQVSGWNPETVAPGNDEVTWAILDDGNANGQAPSVVVSGLATRFPNGYVIQTIAAENGAATYDGVDITDGTTDSPVNYTTYYVTGPASDGYGSDGSGTVGLSGMAGPFTGNSVNINCDPKTAGNRSTLAGFIITDVPVVTRNVPANLLLANGASLILPTPTYIIGVGLTYQWQHAGTNLPGATFSSYTNNSVATTDSGLYQAVVTSSFYPSMSVTGQIANLAVVPTHPARTAYWDPAEAGHADDGSGVWSYSFTNWWSGSIDDYWGNADTAVFGAGGTGAYTVTLGASLTANAITFNSGTYTLTNNAGQALTLQGIPALAGAGNATIAVPVTITTNVLVTTGTGKVTLAGALTCTNVFVTAGTLQVLAKSGGDATYTVTNGATLEIGYSTAGGYANTGLQLYGSGTSATTGLYLLGGTLYNVSGGVVVNGAPTTIRQYGSGMAAFGIFDINSNPGLSVTAAASGSATDPNIELVNDGYGMVVTTAAGANTASGDLVVNGPLNVDARNGVYGLIKRGNGSILLNAAATTNNCELNVAAGSAICGIANCIGSNATLNVAAGAAINLNGFSQTVSNATLAGTLQMTISKSGSPNSDVLTVNGGAALNYGGSLIVTNVGGSLAIGDSFTLFNDVNGYGSMFTNMVLPALANGQGWSNNLAVDGSLYVVAGSVPPSIIADLSGATNYVYAGADQTYTVGASGDATLHYIWLKNGVTRVGADSPTLVLADITSGGSGYYSCTVTNNYGVASSQTNYLSVVTPALAAADAVQDAPGAFWPLNETNGPTAYDYSGAGNNGTQNGTLTLGVAGPRSSSDQGFNSGNTAYLFDGSSSYIACGTGPSLSGTTDFSLEAWVNMTNNAGGVILQQRYASGYNGEYGLAANTNGSLTFYVYGGGAYQFDFSSPASSKYVNDGNWHYVAAVRSGVTGIIYIDGSAVASASGSVVAPLDPTFPTYIGFDQRANGNFFSGMMCNVAIYSHALTPARIADHAFKGVLGTSPLVLSKVAGGFIQDSKPAGTLHHGLNYGTTWLAASTDANNVTRTNVEQFPLGRQIAIPANQDFNTTNGTICFWMQSSLPPAGNGTMLLDRRTSSGLLLFLDGTPSGSIDVQYTGGPNFTAGNTVADGTWHHVALVYDQSASGSVSIFIDGNLSISQANTNAWSWPAVQEIELGRSHDTYWQAYSGQMADLRIYSRILDATEIASIFSSGALVDTTTLEARYNFNTAAGVGTSLYWPVGALQSSPTLGPSVWSPVSNVNNTLPYLLPGGLPWTTNSTLFYGAGY